MISDKLNVLLITSDENKLKQELSEFLMSFLIASCFIITLESAYMISVSKSAI